MTELSTKHVFHDDLTNRLLASCQSLWQEGHVKNLISRFLFEVDSSWEIMRCSLFSYHTKRKTLVVEAITHPHQTYQAVELDEPFLVGIAEKLSQKSTSELHYVKEHKVFVIYFDHINEGQQLLVWQQKKPQEDRLYFLTQVLVNEFHWYAKFDQTKSLLYIDDLTGLYNYRYLDVALTGELRRASRFETPFSLLFIDLDGFKGINDRFGHMTGSSVLRQVADLLKTKLREVDSIIRYGGDEYIVLLIGADGKSAFQVAERIRRAVEIHSFHGDRTADITLTCSIGIASYPEHGCDKTTLIKIADETMYKSKHSGKNCVMIVGEANKQSFKSPHREAYR